MNATLRSIIAAAGGVIIAAATLAQTAPNRPGEEPRQGPADQCYQPPSGSNQRSDDATGRDPGRQLSQSQGVVCPPAKVDPKMTKPAPERGTTPVIPPPGSPGNGSNIQPK